ncbi:alpha/beta fold hydrolase [Halosolutus gelatinilyticus]|uniref:alpha/beta fold hydrolase n=1 Tax=Halosolutus gelatinilyticus TaxID=2931975 RepID=UPI001FF630D7|nr:alpha/beta hydrolase [Halosolutus gelatinilyticus]
MPELTRENGTIWYETTGDGSPLVFVHGGWMNGEAWAPQVDRFADEYRVVTLDVRGHGKTGPTEPDRYSIELFADDLEALLGHLDLEDPVLCGLSLGSMIVQEYLSRHPNRASGAILGGAIRSLPPIDLPPGVKSAASPLPLLSTSLAMTGPKTTFRTMLGSIRTTTGKPWLACTPEVRETALDAVGDVSRSEFRKVFGALYRYEPPALDRVATPTLVIHGAHEAPLVKKQGRRVAATVADGTWLTIDGAAHLVNQDRPEAFNDASTAFLDDRVGA